MKTNELRAGINVGQGLSLFFTEGFEIFVGGVGEEDSLSTHLVEALVC